MSRDRHLAAVIVTEGAPLFETAVPISVFGTDRTDTGAPPLRVIATAESPGAVTTAGLSLSGLHDLDMVGEAGAVIVPAWPHPEQQPSDRLIAALQLAVTEGATVMGLCMGAYALGHAGILDGRRAITHWRWLSDFEARFPEVTVDDSGLYVDEGQIITSAGTAAGLDACLHYIRREWGSEAASAIARRMVVAPHRPGNQNQFIAVEVPRADGPSISAIQERALRVLASSVQVDELARWYGASRRTFDRDFRSATSHQPPATSHSPLATRHSPLATRHSPLATRHSPLATTMAAPPTDPPSPTTPRDHRPLDRNDRSLRRIQQRHRVAAQLPTHPRPQSPGLPHRLQNTPTPTDHNLMGSDN